MRTTVDAIFCSRTPLAHTRRSDHRKHGSRFEKHKTAFEEGAARDDALAEELSHEKDDPSRPTSLVDEKGEKQSHERV